MIREDHVEELVGMTPARPGWFAFFHSPEDEDGPFWGKTIEAWGSFQVIYPENEDLNGIEVHGMIIEQELGMLDGSFVDFTNFLGTFFSGTLLALTESEVAEYADIVKDAKLLQQLERIVADRADAQMLTTPDEYLEDSEDSVN